MALCKVRVCVCVCDIHITGCQQQSWNFRKETKECEWKKIQVDEKNEEEKKNTKEKSFEVFSAYPISSLHLISHAMSFKTKQKERNPIRVDLNHK